jgi:two-component system chemotaxis sensor kinase CheA
MSDAPSFPSDLSPDEMADYLRLYLDETEELLDALVQTMLALEADPANMAGLDEAFRLIHSIKGSAALLGLDRVTSLTHHLESHFEQLRSRRRVLDTATMDIVLRSIDFLRECNRRLRQGQAIAAAGPLLDEVKALDLPSGLPTAPAGAMPLRQASAAAAAPATRDSGQQEPPAVSSAARSWRLDVRFREGLPLAEMKAELVLTRLATLGAITDCQPPRSELGSHSGLRQLSVIVATPADRDTIEVTTRVDGIAALTLEPVATGSAASAAPPPPGSSDTACELATAAAQATANARPADDPGRSGGVSETVRVDVGRLDVLLNLTGELVVNRSRLTQLADSLAPAFRKTGLSARQQSATSQIRSLLAGLDGEQAVPRAERRAIEEQLDSLVEQARVWEDGRRAFGELTAAIDQLTRVAGSLQRGVLDTRMVPVGPLFNRFKRSIRDIARDLGKQVRLEIVGEKTELDRRMIDEIGDPLNHLVRNCIDHGVESAELRRQRGKPDVATLTLTAAHRGNNVFITVADDGGGIDIERVRQTAVARGLLSAEAARALPDREAIALIFTPGFSTATRVSDISGRGVGMDIVRTRIAALNGAIDVDSTSGRGTRFTIRLPLTLTITRCMLFRLAQGTVAVPIDHVREITRVDARDHVAVGGQRMCDLRGELIRIVRGDELFTWTHQTPAAAAPAHVAVLQSGTRSFGLLVDEPLGSRDLVVKPLDEHFIHIRGLGGASILGDGSVCLVLDVMAGLDLISRDAPPAAAASH